VKGKVKAVPLYAKQAQRRDKGIALPILDPGIRTGWLVSATPSDLPAKKETWYPLYRRLCEPQGQSGWVCNVSVPLGLEPLTIQPVMSAIQTMLSQVQCNYFVRIYFLDSCLRVGDLKSSTV
jgi:hypothetical protein